MLKSKIHRTTVTGSDLNNVGSRTVDALLLEAADILPREQVSVVNVDNGQCFETYVLDREAGLGEMQVNGAAARLVHHGDTAILFSYAQYDEAGEAREHVSRVVHVDGANRIVAVDDRTAALRQ